MNLSDELLGLFSLLEQRKLRFAVCGELGAAFQGSSKFTRQVDLLIRPEDLASCVAAVGERELRPTGQPAPWCAGSELASTVHVFVKGKEPDTLALHVVVLPAALGEVWSKRRLFQWRDVKVQVVSTAGLKTIKAAAEKGGGQGSPSASAAAFDTSAAGIERRIQDLAKNYELGVSLRCATSLGNAEELLAANAQ